MLEHDIKVKAGVKIIVNIMKHYKLLISEKGFKLHVADDNVLEIYIFVDWIKNYYKILRGLNNNHPATCLYLQEFFDKNLIFNGFPLIHFKYIQYNNEIIEPEEKVVYEVLR